MSTSTVHKLEVFDTRAVSCEPYVLFTLSYGILYCYSPDGVLYFDNVPRNVISRTQSFRPAYGCVWKGHTCTKNLTMDCTMENSSELAAGNYRLRYAALKHFGDKNKPDDYDVYYTPPFSLVY